MQDAGTAARWVFNRTWPGAAGTKNRFHVEPWFRNKVEEASSLFKAAGSHFYVIVIPANAEIFSGRMILQLLLFESEIQFESV